MVVVMGLDPGLATTGYGVLQVTGNSYEVIAYDCLRTPAGLPDADRLEMLYRLITTLHERHRPQEVAVEQLFFHRNVTTALQVGQARGVALLAAAQAGARIIEYTPLQIKQGITGSGRADKKQVQYMVRTILGLAVTPQPDDVADALAVALCHCHHRRMEALV
ncbi:MAG: crossover junction endodeoxyribonuclease RuvC [Bacillota bacterium]